MSRDRGHAGMSLVEVMVAMTLMLVIVPVFAPLLLSATRSARALGATDLPTHLPHFIDGQAVDSIPWK